MWKRSKNVEEWKSGDGRAQDVGEALVAHPAGLVELQDEDLEFVVGGQAAPDQTGTGSPACECVITQTAVSGGGSCYCTCKAQPAPVEPVLV